MAAAENDHTSACLADIQQCYLKWFPIDSQHNINPDPEWLAAINNNEAEPEVPAPDPEEMLEEEYLQAMKAFRFHGQQI